MVWDATLPPGSEAKSNGDNRIRELKEDIEASLTAAGSFPGADTSNPEFHWTGSRGNTASRPGSPVTNQLYFNTQIKRIEYWDGAAWQNVDTIPGAINVDENMLATSVAGDGLAGGAGTALSVTVDGVTIEINADTLRVKDLGISTGKIAANAVDENKIATSVAGSGLTGGGGSALAVNVDDSTIEIATDTLQLKDGGTTETKLTTAVQNKLGQNIGAVSRPSDTNNTTSFETVVNYTGQGMLMGVSVIPDSGNNAEIRITIDGTTHGVVTVSASTNSHIEFGAGGAATMFQAVAGLGQMDELRVHFYSGFSIEHRNAAGAGPTCVTYAQYEKQA